MRGENEAEGKGRAGKQCKMQGGLVCDDTAVLSMSHLEDVVEL